MAIVGEQHGIFPKLKSFVESGKPVRAGFVPVPPQRVWLAPSDPTWPSTFSPNTTVGVGHVRGHDPAVGQGRDAEGRGPGAGGRAGRGGLPQLLRQPGVGLSR